ncbi:MAG: hypothetical protein AAGJ79_11605, partial [Verrucomicrobiota bacterium]
MKLKGGRVEIRVHHDQTGTRVERIRVRVTLKEIVLAIPIRVVIWVAIRIIQSSEMLDLPG